MQTLEYKTVNRWLNRQSESARHTNEFIIRDFFKFVEDSGGKWGSLNPDDFILYQAKMNSEPNGKRFQILDLAQDYIDSKKLRYNSKVRYYTAIRSFFAHNRAELPPDKTYTIDSDVEPVEGTLTVEEVRHMILSSKPVYQAIISSMLVAGMDQEMLVHWNLTGWPSLKKAIEEDADIVRIDLPGRKKRKNKVPYYAFIGGDALELVKKYANKFRSEVDKERKTTTAIFLDQHKNPLTKVALAYYWRRHAIKIGLWEPVKDGPKSTRHGKGLHEMRDVFRALWERSPASTTAGEFFMGHTVDKLGYNKIMKDEKWARREYEKALPYLNILSEDKAYGKVDENEIERLNNRINELEKEKQEYSGKYEGLLRRMDELSRQFREHLEQEKK
jgi:site-specific recombinase XerD